MHTKAPRRFQIADTRVTMRKDADRSMITPPAATPCGSIASSFFKARCACHLWTRAITFISQSTLLAERSRRKKSLRIPCAGAFRFREKKMTALARGSGTRFAQ
jgi:hypothetical protein